MRSGISYTKQLQQIANDFYIATGRTTATKDEIARWAIRNQRWMPHPEANVKQCAEELARAMREDYETDLQGRRVRVKHAATVERNGRQTTLWADVRNAPRQFMEVAFRQRRQQIVGGADIRNVQKTLRHNSLQTTEIYLNETRRLTEAAERSISYGAEGE